MEEPTTNLQPKNLLLWAGNEVRVGLGALGTPKRVHQDIGVEECPQQAAKVDRQVSQTPWTHTQKSLQSQSRCNASTYSKIRTFSWPLVELFNSLRPPASKVFNTFIPRSILISPGTSFSMQVTFKPQQKVKLHNFLMKIILTPSNRSHHLH